MTNIARFQTAADVFDELKSALLSGDPPTYYRIGTGDLNSIEIGPGRVTLIGGAPGAGKTALTMQAAVDAIRLTADLRALVCNVEMPPMVLLERQLARLSGIDLETIRHRRLGTEHADRVERGLETIADFSERLCFVRPPFDLVNIAACADRFEADLILLDYIQRIAPPGKYGDSRSAVNATMDYLREFADADRAVLVVAAVGRTKDAKGRTSYDGASLNLASFRESSELEFGADDAFILVPDPAADDQVILRHLKSRHGRARDVTLRFFGDLQRFESLATSPKLAADTTSISASLMSAWDRTPAADQAEEEDDE